MQATTLPVRPDLDQVEPRDERRRVSARLRMRSHMDSDGLNDVMFGGALRSNGTRACCASGGSRRTTSRTGHSSGQQAPFGSWVASSGGSRQRSSAARRQRWRRF